MTSIIEWTTLSGEHHAPSMFVESGLSLFKRDRDLFGTETVQLTKHLPEQIITAYIREALKLADARRLDDGSWFLEIPGFPGVWADGEDLGAASDELRDVLFDWLILKIQQNDRNIPSVGQIALNTI